MSEAQRIVQLIRERFGTRLAKAGQTQDIPPDACCVGGALLQLLGDTDSRFPGRYRIGEALNSLRVSDPSTAACRVVDDNDWRSPEHALVTLQATLETCDPEKLAGIR